MRIQHMLAFGLVLSLPILCAQVRVEADGPLKRHHQGNCPAEQNSVIRLPAQTIRIETTKPRVVVNEISSPSRLRGYFPGHTAMPFTSGPFVATILSPGALQSGTGTGSSALDAVHALERQALEFSRHKAAMQAEMSHVDKAQQRIVGNLTSGAQPVVSDAAQLKTAIENLSKRVSDIERLLIIHDNLLKEKEKK